MATADEIEADDDFVDDEDDAEDDAGDEDVEVVAAPGAGVGLDTLETFADPEDDDATDDDKTGPADAVVTPLTDDGDEEDGGPDLDEEADDVEEEEAEESLDVLLAREKAAAAEPDLGRLEEPRDGLSIPAIPISAEEFTCRSCFLVKNRAQVADADQLICLDCA